MSKWAGHVGPTWAAQITPLSTYNARLAHVGPSRHLHRGTHQGPIWVMWFKWASGIWDPCGQPQIYPMWASGIWDPCGQPQIYPMWASGIWDPCGKPQIYPMWASGIWDPCGQPQIYPMWASGIWDPCGKPQIYPMWASVYLLTLGLVVTDCYLKYMYQTICEIDPCLIEQNQHFVNVPNF